MENILITLDQLGIGGVETHVVNQVKILRKLGKNVFVMSKKGSYVDTIKSTNAKFVEHEFSYKTYYDKDEVDFIANFIKKNNITQVQVNQFTAINAIVPACLLTNTPYVAYLHIGVGFLNDPEKNPFDFFEKQYFTYKKMFEMFFKNASAVVTITEVLKNYTAQRYNVDKDKIFVRPNSIDTSEFKGKRPVKKVEKIFVIGRLSEEKELSIINSIDLYKNLKEKNKNAKLAIAGDGPCRENIENYVLDNNIEDVEFLGAISNVKEEMDNYDLVIGQGRCLLEAMSMKKLAFISGYDHLKGFVDEKNFGRCINDNFTGKSLNRKPINKLMLEIEKLNEKEIKELINTNHKKLVEKLDATKNVFCLNERSFKGYDSISVYKDMIELIDLLGKQEKEYHDKADEIWKAYKNYEKRMNKRYFLFEKILRFNKKAYLGFKRILNMSEDRG